jgi:flagellar motor switch protein FliM
MADFEESWQDVHPLRVHLRKVTTFLFRARILSSHERCLVAQIHLSGEHVSARLTWCFPRILLDPILPELQAGRVIPSLVPERQSRARLPGASALESMDYRLTVSLGRLDPKPGFAFEEGGVIPLRAEAGGQAVILVNGRPLLIGTVGEAQGRYAVRVTAPYREERPLQLPDSAAFRPVQWPSHPQ